MRPGSRVGLGLGVMVAGLFCLPAYLVSRGATVAGDRQTQSAEEVLKLDVSKIQREHRARQRSSGDAAK